MRKTTLITAALTVFLLCAQPRAHGQYVPNTGGWGVLGNLFEGTEFTWETQDTISDMLDYRAEPIVNEVTTNPRRPAAGEDVVVTAVTGYSPGMRGDEISDVFINFSTDSGASISRVAMERDPADKRIWKGTIPGQPSGANVIFGLQALNVFDEAFVEALCEAEEGLHTDYVNDADDCTGDLSSGICRAGSPHGCMLPMSTDPGDFDPYRIDIQRINPDLDIKFTRVGFNSREIIIDMGVQGEISSGSLSPMDAHIYAVGWIDPDRGSGDVGMNAILEQGAVVFYAPLNPTYKCALYRFGAGKTLEIDSASTTCAPARDRLLFSVNRSAFGPKPAERLEFVFMTFTVMDMSQPVFKLSDLTRFTRVSFASRGYSVP